MHEPHLSWETIVPWDEWSARRDISLGVQQIDAAKESEVAAIVMPFVEIITDTTDVLPHQVGVGQMINFLDNKLSHRVPVICFANSTDGWRQHFRAIAPDTHEIRENMEAPRLVGWMSADGRIEWAIAGVILEPNQDFVLQLEETGEAVAKTPEEKLLALDLAAHQANHLKWNEEAATLKLPLHNARVKIEDHQRAVLVAWKVYWQSPDIRKSVLTEKEGCAILLATGTRIRRHFSVFRLLQQSSLLTEALGAIFARILQMQLEMTQRLVIVIDQPASKYMCHALFVNKATSMPDVLSLEEVSRAQAKPSKVVLFADAILKGHTFRTAVEKLISMGIAVRCVVTCADLRAQKAKSEFFDIPVISLIDVSDLEPEIISNGNSNLRDIQIDAITHVPIDQRSSPFVDLAWGHDVRAFLEDNPELFSVGYQRLSERTHIITLPLGRVFQSESHASHVVKWIVLEVSRRIKSMGLTSVGHSIAIFSRYDSKIGELENPLVHELQEVLKGNEGIFFVRLPAAYRDAHSFFPHHGFDLFADCKDKTGVEFSNQGRKPKSGYIGIYLDDATVTGNSLRDFLNRAMEQTEPKPSGIVALAVVNRLSPGEVRFFELCKELQSSGRPYLKVPFLYSSIFNLQVRSQRHQLVAGHRLLDEIVESKLFHHPDLSDYVGSLRKQYRSARSKVAWRHLFAPNEQSAVVSTGAVRFRHLLALNQQNEPVIVEIMNLLQSLTDPKVLDASLLTVLAIEPALLLEPTLRQFGREIIIRLAIHTLNGSECIARKSDALAVLATYPEAFIDHFAEFAPFVLEEKSLSTQLAVHLLANVAPRSESDYPPELPDLTTKATEGQAWLHRMMKVAKRAQELTNKIQKRKPAEQAIFTLGSHFTSHSQTNNADWRVAWISLDNLVQRWSKLASIQRRTDELASCRRQAIFAERILLPAFPALIHFLEQEIEHDGVEALQSACLTAHDKLHEFVAVLPTDVSGFVLDRAKLALHRLEQLRQATWMTQIPSDRILSGQEILGDCGPLAKWFPKAFCAPSALLVRIGESMFETNATFAEFQEFGPKKHWITIAPVPTKILDQILRLLFQNVAIHGITSSLRVSHIHPADHDWTVRIANKASKPSNLDNGTGRGLQVAKDHAERYGIVLKIEQPSDPDQEWVALLTIPNVFKIDQEIEML